MNITHEQDFPQRASGRTTRLVDAAIQVLFAKGSIELGGPLPNVTDHHASRQNQEHMFRRILQRMQNEHKLSLDVDSSRLRIALSEHPGNKKVVFEQVKIKDNNKNNG